jgi:CBS domain-containing protein
MRRTEAVPPISMLSHTPAFRVASAALRIRSAPDCARSLPMARIPTGATMKIQDIMTANPSCVTPEATIREAAHAHEA